MYVNESFIMQAVPAARVVRGAFPSQFSVGIDSREIIPGQIFIPLQGARVDGHDFLEQALDNGAVGCFLDEQHVDLIKKFSTRLSDKLVVVVPDTKHALLACAAAWRKQFTYPVIAITGSVGKTTTKMLVGHILQTAKKAAVVSAGNQNTDIGVALNIFAMRPTHEAAIFEVGISHRGEMANIAKLLRPTNALITAIGHQHMEGLGSVSDIAQEKRDIFKYFTETNIGIINGDQQWLADVAYSHPVIKFGNKTTNQVQARKVSVGPTSTSFVLKLYNVKMPVTLPTSHPGAVTNALAATAIAHVLGVDQEIIIAALEQGVVVPARFEKRQLKNVHGVVINDCYNASPESVKAALLALERLPAEGTKIAVLGDMLDLGADSPFWHRQLGRFLCKVPSLSRLILVGDLVKWIKETAPMGLEVEHVQTLNDAVNTVSRHVTQDSVVLVKGSHDMHLDQVVEHLSK